MTNNRKVEKNPVLLLFLFVHSSSLLIGSSLAAPIRANFQSSLQLVTPVPGDRTLFQVDSTLFKIISFERPTSYDAVQAYFESRLGPDNGHGGLAILKSAIQEEAVTEALVRSRFDSAIIGLRRRRSMWRWVNSCTPIRGQGFFSMKSANAKLKLSCIKDCVSYCEFAGEAFASYQEESQNCFCIQKADWKSNCGTRGCSTKAAEYGIYAAVNSSYDHWAAGYPKLDNGCAAISHTDGNLWIDRDCSEKLPFICEFDRWKVNDQQVNKPVCFDRKCYSLVTEQVLNFENANKHCQAQGGGLATIDSFQDQLDIEMSLANFSSSSLTHALFPTSWNGLPKGNYVWIGARNLFYAWPDESAAESMCGYNNWHFGEPNAIYDCVALVNVGGVYKWKTSQCDNARVFVGSFYNVIDATVLSDVRVTTSSGVDEPQVFIMPSTTPGVVTLGTNNPGAVLVRAPPASRAANDSNNVNGNGPPNCPPCENHRGAVIALAIICAILLIIVIILIIVICIRRKKEIAPPQPPPTPQPEEKPHDPVKDLQELIIEVKEHKQGQLTLINESILQANMRIDELRHVIEERPEPQPETLPPPPPTEPPKTAVNICVSSPPRDRKEKAVHWRRTSKCRHRHTKRETCRHCESHSSESSSEEATDRSKPVNVSQGEDGIVNVSLNVGCHRDGKESESEEEDKKYCQVMSEVSVQNDKIHEHSEILASLREQNERLIEQTGQLLEKSKVEESEVVIGENAENDLEQVIEIPMKDGEQHKRIVRLKILKPGPPGGSGRTTIISPRTKVAPIKRKGSKKKKKAPLIVVKQFSPRSITTSSNREDRGFYVYQKPKFQHRPPPVKGPVDIDTVVSKRRYVPPQNTPTKRHIGAPYVRDIFRPGSTSNYHVSCAEAGGVTRIHTNGYSRKVYHPRSAWVRPIPRRY